MLNQTPHWYHRIGGIMFFVGGLTAATPAVSQEDDAPALLDLPTLEEELGRVSPESAPLSSGIEAQPLPEPGTQPAAGGDATAAPVPEIATPGKIVILDGLDKITARVSSFQVPVDQPTRFGSLIITARDCHKRPPEDPPETSAFLDIADIGAARQSADANVARQVFSGWMFASNPALSALEHPVYDVWVMDCITSAPESGSVTPSGRQ